jgi:hypothetical protein
MAVATSLKALLVVSLDSEGLPVVHKCTYIKYVQYHHTVRRETAQADNQNNSREPEYSRSWWFYA